MICNRPFFEAVATNVQSYFAIKCIKDYRASIPKSQEKKCTLCIEFVLVSKFHKKISDKLMINYLSNKDFERFYGNRKHKYFLAILIIIFPC